MQENKKIKIELIAMGAVIIAITAALIVFFFQDQIFHRAELIKEAIVNDSTNDSGETRHPLSGKKVEEEYDSLQVYGVMVENMVEAWPLSGIAQAALVIEAPVEAAIPRLLAFFTEDQTVSMIGPVRSARPYYLDWAKGLDALYVHVGGSPEALEIINEGGLLDLNEFYYGWLFWRDDSRGAPHNVYTSTDLLASAMAEFAEDSEVAEPDYLIWNFKDDAEALPETEHMIEIVFSQVYGDLYKAGWKYKKESNDYLRYQNNYVHNTRDGADIRANNIVIIETEIQVIDEIGRRWIETLGSGDALLIQDGLVTEATWSKASSEDRLQILNKESGEELAFNAGVTWVEIVSDLEAVEIFDQE